MQYVFPERRDEKAGQHHAGKKIREEQREISFKGRYLHHQYEYESLRRFQRPQKLEVCDCGKGIQTAIGKSASEEGIG